MDDGEMKMFCSMAEFSYLVNSALIKLTEKARSPPYTMAWENMRTCEDVLHHTLDSSSPVLSRNVSLKVPLSSPKQFLSRI